MQISRQQRINGIPGEMITEARKLCERFRTFLKDGIDLEAGKPPGHPAFKCSGEEIKEAFGDGLKDMETWIGFALDGKSNQITKGRKPEKAE